MGASDDDIDLFCASLDRLLDFSDALGQGRLSGWKTRRHRGYRDICASEGFDLVSPPAGVYAHRADVDSMVGDLHGSQNVRSPRLPCFGAQTPDPARRVLAGEGGEVDAG